MNLNEALDLLTKNNYLTELSALPKIYDNDYGKYAKMTNKGREKRNAKITYKDDERYNDHEGTLWLDVKQKDHFTLTLAALSGLIDSGGIDYYDDGIKQNYPAGTTMKDIFNLDVIEGRDELLDELSHFPRLKKLIDKICEFLEDKMNKKHLRVYRGLELNSHKLAELYKKDKYIFQSPVRLVQYLDNTTKEFNSFSVDEEIAINFTDSADDYIVFSGEIDNNDVNWAFTAYLMGRHSSIGEAELNLNNLKRLKNIRINYLNITDSTKKEAKLIVNHPDLTYAKKLPISADYFLIRSNESTGYSLVDSNCKKILNEPIKSFFTYSAIQGYYTLEFKNNKSCLISEETGKILFKNGCDKILSVRENNIYVKNGDYYYIFDENENLLYKTSTYIVLTNDKFTFDGDEAEIVRVYPSARIDQNQFTTSSPFYNAILKDGKFMFPKSFMFYDKLQDAIREKRKELTKKYL